MRGHHTPHHSPRGRKPAGRVVPVRRELHVQGAQVHHGRVDQEDVQVQLNVSRAQNPAALAGRGERHALRRGKYSSRAGFQSLSL